MIRVLKAAAEKFGWTPQKAPSGRGFGVACATDSGAYVTLMAEVKVDKELGNVQVKRIVCAQDMGLAINPEGAKIQMEGGVTMGLGYALAEEIHFKGGDILDRNFDTYQLPQFTWLPKIETVLIDAKNSPPQGGGEPAIVAMGARDRQCHLRRHRRPAVTTSHDPGASAWPRSRSCPSKTTTAICDSRPHLFLPSCHRD